MDDKYYRDLIDKVNRNEKAMWGGTDEPNDGYEDFNQLWGILGDEDVNVAPKTYFEAMELCINSFFGTIQDHSHVWRNIATHYAEALKDEAQKQSFNTELERFLNDVQSAVPDMEIYYDLMHSAIEDGNFRIANLLINHSPIEIEDWDQLEDDYQNYPEWAAYIEGLTDISYDHLPDAPIFKETIKKLYSAFGNLPNMEKLNNLYHRYF
ncbi:MAG: hypothetical protein K2L17_07565 [Muribaculaceae bacterium]|nr:hypothetical protein [Muribaculaceae bacterium]